MAEPINIVKFSKVMAKNKAWVTLNWQLLGVEEDGLIYESEKQSLGDTWILDMNKEFSSQVDGMQMRLKANVNSGDDSKSSVILQYDLTSSDTVYFELTGTAFETTLTYKGIL